MGVEASSPTEVSHHRDGGGVDSEPCTDGSERFAGFIDGRGALEHSGVPLLRRFAAFDVIEVEMFSDGGWIDIPLGGELGDGCAFAMCRDQSPGLGGGEASLGRV